MKPTLLILAAGLGSRYGGLKQMEPFGPSGETIMDYSVHDALLAGFAKVVFVIRRDFEAEFRELVGRKYESRVAVEYVFQDLAALPSGFRPPPGRTKPWGTAHAIWCARHRVAEPFLSINADDFYGRDGYRLAADHLTKPPWGDLPEYCLVGYPVLQTLSEHGAVARALCAIDAHGYLEGLVERTRIVKAGATGSYSGEDGAPCPLTGDEIVSMNMLGFAPAVFPQLERHLAHFLEGQRKASDNAECLIPVVLNALVEERAARVRVLRTQDRWFGVTHADDKPGVSASLRAMVQRGQYPSPIC